MSRERRRRLVAFLSLLSVLALLALVPGGCSDDATGPGSGGAGLGQQDFSGRFDPNGGTFTLQKVDLPDSGRGAVELVGSNLVVDPQEEIVEITVALRNATDQPLHAPATVWVSGFRPPEVTVVNADLAQGAGQLPADGGEADTTVVAWGFQYGDLFGDDGVLAPGEVSGGKPWRFHVPGLGAFAFAVRLEFGLRPGLPVLGGLIWQDDNANGVRDRGEPPSPAGHVEVGTPAGLVLTARPNERGRWSVPVQVPGLYRATYFPPPTMGPVPPVVTTPNPLAVVLTATVPGGPPQSFLEASFGWVLHLPPSLPPPIILTDAPPDSLNLAPFNLLGYAVEGSELRLRVGFSGCQPEHPFTLFMSGGFRETDPAGATTPAAAVLVLQHDDLGEMCDAFWGKGLTFDLTPMIRAFLREHPDGGIIVAHLLGPQGEVAVFRVPVSIRGL